MKQIEALDASGKNKDFLEDLNLYNYKGQVKEQKDEILTSIRRRIVRETGRASLLGSKEAKVNGSVSDHGIHSLPSAYVS